MYNADCSRCVCIHVPGVRPVTQKEISPRSSRRMDAGLESTGFSLFDLGNSVCFVCVWIGFVFHYLFVLLYFLHQVVLLQVRNNVFFIDDY